MWLGSKILHVIWLGSKILHVIGLGSKILHVIGLGSKILHKLSRILICFLLPSLSYLVFLPFFGSLLHMGLLSSSICRRFFFFQTFYPETILGAKCQPSIPTKWPVKRISDPKTTTINMVLVMVFFNLISLISFSIG